MDNLIHLIAGGYSSLKVHSSNTDIFSFRRLSRGSDRPLEGHSYSVPRPAGLQRGDTESDEAQGERQVRPHPQRVSQYN